MTYLRADFISDFLESLPHRFDRTSGLEDESSLALLVVKLGLGAPVDIADDLVDGLLQLTARGDLVGSEGDALGVFSGDVHGREGGATAGSRWGRARRAAIDAVGGDRGRLLAPGGRDRSLSALGGTESWEGLLRRCVESRLLGVPGLLLASGFLAERSRAIGRGVSKIILVGDVLDSDMVIFYSMIVHEPLRRGQTVVRGSNCFRCHD